MPEVEILKNSTLLYIQNVWIGIAIIMVIGLLLSTDNDGNRKKSPKDVFIIIGGGAVVCFIAAFTTAAFMQVGYAAYQVGEIGFSRAYDAVSHHPKYLILVVSVFTYFLPSLIAVIRRHKKLFGIIILNLITGLTIIGWIAAFIWAWIDTRDQGA